MVCQHRQKASAGILEGKPDETVVGPGCPTFFEEPMQQVSFKEQNARVKAMDERAAQLGIRRSDCLRRLVENDLQCAGMI